MADYFIAEQQGWMLYLEGSTDLAILRKLAERLRHPAYPLLQAKVPVNYLGTNKPQEARDHFHGLREAKPNLVGFALFDRLDKELQTGFALVECMWTQREIENYLATPASLRQFVQCLSGSRIATIRAGANSFQFPFSGAINESNTILERPCLRSASDSCSRTIYGAPHRSGRR